MIHAILRLLIRSASILLGTLQLKLNMLVSGQKLPKGLTVDGFIFWKVSKHGQVNIGRNFKLNSRPASNLVGITNRASFQVIDKGEITIGDSCGFTSTVLSCRTNITIGDHVKVGANVRIFDHDYHALNPDLRRSKETDGKNVKSVPVLIGDDVFIGTNAIILRGTRIGARSIIGAGSVVGGLDIPPDSLVVGNPAKIVSKKA